MVLNGVEMGVWGAKREANASKSMEAGGMARAGRVL
jgi:hypothetical protein